MKCKINIDNVWIDKPCFIDQNEQSSNLSKRPLMPKDCFKHKLSYNGDMYMDITVSVTKYYKDN